MITTYNLHFSGYENFFCALYCYGANVELCNIDDEAKWLLDIWNEKECIDILQPGDDDFEVYCARLDLDPVKNDVKCIHKVYNYNDEALIVCFKNCWKYSK